MSTEDTCDFSLLFKIIISVLLVLTLIMSTLENVLVCVAVYKRKELRTAANVLIVSLAVSDIIIGLVVPTMELCYVIPYPYWPLGAEGTNVQNSFWLFSMAMPFITVTVITVDRYRAVTSLTRYKERVTWKTGVIMVIIIWLFVTGDIALMAFNFSPPLDDQYEWNVKEVWYYSFLGCHVLLPLVIIITLYYHILRVARTSRAHVCMNANSNTTSTSARREMKLAKAIGIIIGLLFLVWLPVLGLEVVYAFDSTSCIVSQLGVVSVWITCVNGIINPWVYWRQNIDFRNAFMCVFTSIRHCLAVSKPQVLSDQSEIPSTDDCQKE